MSLAGTQIGIDGKRHAIEDLGDVTPLPVSYGLHVHGQPAQGKVPIWNENEGHLEYGFPTSADGTFVVGDQSPIPAPDTSAAVELDVTALDGGATDGTVGAIPDPADAPADADALRDDLVTNVLPAIRDALAELAAAHTGNRTALLSVAETVNTTITRMVAAGEVNVDD